MQALRMRKTMLGSTFFVLSLVLGAPLAAAAPGKAPATKKRVKHVPKVTIETARATALAKVPGTIHSEELEKEHGRWIYSFVVVPAQGEPGFVKEVNVDADHGTVVDIETERAP